MKAACKGDRVIREFDSFKTRGTIIKKLAFGVHIKWDTGEKSIEDIATLKPAPPAGVVLR